MKISISNRLPELLKQKRVRSASEFGRLMTEAGYRMSSAQASRYVKDDMPSLEPRFIETACNVLQCFPSELFNITAHLESDEAIDPRVTPPRHAFLLREAGTPATKPTVAAEPPPDHKNVAKASEKFKKNYSQNVGPKITPFPVGKK